MLLAAAKNQLAASNQELVCAREQLRRLAPQQHADNANAKLAQQLASSQALLTAANHQLAASKQEVVMAREQIGRLAPQLEAVEGELGRYSQRPAHC